MKLSESPRLHMERAGILPTTRDLPVMATDNPTHQYPATWPNPLPSVSLAESGSPAPDRVTTRIWPHGGPPT
jgi:hypothetical protein